MHTLFKHFLLRAVSLTSLLVTAHMAMAAVPALTISPSVQNINLRSDGTTLIQYTVMNNFPTSVAITSISSDSVYSGIQPTQFGTCNNATVGAGQSCTFNLLLQNVSASFYLRPKVCFNLGGSISCAVATQNNTVNVAVTQIPSNHITQAYIAGAFDNVLSAIAIASHVSTMGVYGLYNFNNGTSPIGIATSLDGSKVYIANQGDGSAAGTVSVVNTQRISAVTPILANINVGTLPTGVALTPDGSKVYVANNSDGTVSVINTATNSVIKTITVGAGPMSVAVSPDSKKVYVANSTAGTISVINAATNSVSATVTVGNTPMGVAVTPDGLKVYVTNYADNTVSVINASNNTVSATISVGSGPEGVIVIPGTVAIPSKAYVVNATAGTVSVINVSTSQVIKTISSSLMTPLTGLSMTPNGAQLYLEGNDTSISVINTNTDGEESQLIGTPTADSVNTLGNFIG
jgi:YVTN family beta-propeller protein